MSISKESLGSDSAVRDRYFSDGETSSDHEALHSSTSTPSSTPKPKRKKTAKIYEFFTFNENKERFQCNHCR